MNFNNPYWFAAFLLLPVVWYFYRESMKKKKALAIKFSNISLIKEAGAGKSKAKEIIFYMNIILITLLVIALADLIYRLRRPKKV